MQPIHRGQPGALAHGEEPPDGGQPARPARTDAPGRQERRTGVPAPEPLAGRPAERGGARTRAAPQSTSRREFSTPFNSRVRTPGPTDLHAFAAVSSELDRLNGVPPRAPQPSRLNAMASAVKRTIGLHDDATWMAERIRAVRADAFVQKNGSTRSAPTCVLPDLARNRSISDIWRALRLSETDSLGSATPALLDRFDTFARSNSPRLAMTLALACRSVHAGQPEHDGRLVHALDLLQDTGSVPLREWLSRRPSSEDPPPAALEAARSILSSICDNNCFAALVEALVPNLEPPMQPVLRRLLQAERAAMAGGTDGALPERVRQAAQETLAEGRPSTDQQQRVDAFLWDNGFRDEGEGSELAELKQHFFAGLDALAAPGQHAGPIQAAATYGLGGANLHVLEEEQARLMAALRTPHALPTPALASLTEGLSHSIDAKLQQAKTVLLASNAPLGEQQLDEIGNLLALSLSLHRWQAVARLSPSDVVHGPAFDTKADSEDQAAVARACRAFVRDEDAANLPVDIESGVRPEPSHADSSRIQLEQQLRERVRDKVGIRLQNLEGLLDAARGVDVRLAPEDYQALERALDSIHATSLRPDEATASGAARAMAQFLGDVQFGNHCRLSSIQTTGVTTRGAGVGISSLPPGEEFQNGEVPIGVRGDLTFDRTVERFIRAGAATHGGELIVGKEIRTRGQVGAGAQGGRQWGEQSANARIAAGADLTFYGRDTQRYEGAMFRVDRRVLEDRVGDDGPVFRQNDDDVRATMADMARCLFEEGSTHTTRQAQEGFFHQFVNRFMDRGLSLTLMQQESQTHRSDFTASLGASLANPSTPRGGFGARASVGASVGIEKGWHFALTEKDRTGRYRINNLRTGWFNRTKAGATIPGMGLSIESMYGLPALRLIGAAISRADGGGSVRVRVPRRDGNIVPEKTFSDTETADKAFFKDLVLANKNKWIDLFAYKYRGQEDALGKGEAAMNAFFYKADEVYDANHVYYARERMHPDVAVRLDELAGMEHQIPLGDRALDGLRAEIAGQRRRLASDDRSWMAASLIAYQKESRQDAFGWDGLGGKSMRASAVEGEREFIFDTIGWANLRQRERDRPPTHLDE